MYSNNNNKKPSKNPNAFEKHGQTLISFKDGQTDTAMTAVGPSGGRRAEFDMAAF